MSEFQKRERERSLNDMDGPKFDTSVAISSIIESQIEKYVNDPRYANFTPEQIATSIFAGMQMLTLDKITAYANAAKK